MRYLYLMLTVTIILLLHLEKVGWGNSSNLQQDDALNAMITSPMAGQVVQGAVVVRGTSSMDGFQSFEVDFSSPADTTQTWFLIQESTLPILNGILAVWDTSTITDGDYDLRLLINRNVGDQVEMIVSNLRVRNYTSIEMVTPSPTLAYRTRAAVVPTLTVSVLQITTPIATSMPPTPTNLPPNPAQISTSRVMLTFGKGVAITVGIFAILGAYLGFRNALHSRR